MLRTAIVKGYEVSEVKNTSNNKNKWFIRIGEVGSFDRAFFQWDLSYKEKGEHPRQLKSSDRKDPVIPMDIVIDGFRAIYEGVVCDDTAPSSVITDNTVTNGSVTKNDVLLAIVNNCNGDKDILNRVLDLLSNTEGTSNKVSSSTVTTPVTTEQPKSTVTTTKTTDTKTDDNKPVVDNTPISVGEEEDNYIPPTTTRKRIRLTESR